MAQPSNALLTIPKTLLTANGFYDPFVNLKLSGPAMEPAQVVPPVPLQLRYWPESWGFGLIFIRI